MGITIQRKPSPYTIDENIVRMQLKVMKGNGEVCETIFDVEDLPRVLACSVGWEARNVPIKDPTRKLRYAVSRHQVQGRQFDIPMHRLIMQAQKGVIIDHKNRNALDNRRENLRVATTKESLRNKSQTGDLVHLDKRGMWKVSAGFDLESDARLVAVLIKRLRGY